jgi:hypothetical protein
MKIRNHRKYEWWFRPSKLSKFEKNLYRFKYKSDLIKFLNKNFEESINGTVSLDHKSFNSSNTIREWFVWYNDYDVKGSKLKIELRQLLFRGRKFISKNNKISKEDKKYFAFSDKIVSLMCGIYEEDGKTILPNKAEKLIELFKKRGFKDFEPTEEDLSYINGHILDGICFWHWSDRCNFLRCKVILEFFKHEGLLK